MEGNINKTSAQEDIYSTYPVPFKLEIFRQDITEVFFYQMRIIAQMTDPKTALKILSIETEDDGYIDDIYDPDNSAADVGLIYDHIRNTTFAAALERLYEYAFYGKWDLNAESMGDEGIYMWVSGIVCDALYSDTTANWNAFGWDIESHAKRCVLVAETANARNTLEGGERFHHFSKIGTKSDIASDDDVLTIRQMALLSGMEEMSIRSAANPKRANPLNTFTDEGGTRVKLDVAKAWLQSKGRYLAITNYRSEGTLDLTKRKFSNYYDLWLALNEQFLKISDRDGVEPLTIKLKAIGLMNLPSIKSFHTQTSIDNLSNEKLMHALAKILELPPELLALRTKELVANQILVDVEKQLRIAVNTTSNIDSL